MISIEYWKIISISNIYSFHSAELFRESILKDHTCGSNKNCLTSHMSMGKLNQTISWEEVGRRDNENHLDPAAALHSVQLMKIDTYPHSPSSSPTFVLDQQPSPDSEIHLTRRRNTIDMTQKYIWNLTLILTHRPLRQLSSSTNSHHQTQEKKEHTERKGWIHIQFNSSSNSIL